MYSHTTGLVIAFLTMGAAAEYDEKQLSPGAGDPSVDKPAAIQKHWLDVSRQYAEAMKLTGRYEPILLEQPVFRHTQSVRGDDIGAVHLWVDEDDRPAVIGSIFAWTKSATHRMVSIEFHSLFSDGAVSLSHKDRQLWRTASPGIVWQVFPNEITPATSDAATSKSIVRRKLQARQLARRFSSKTMTPAGEEWELRSIPKPIHEYSSKKNGILYGGLFAFCQGTDSEVLLLVESTSTKDESETWRFSLVPFTDYDAVVSLNGKEIWQSPKGQMNDNNKPHFWALLEESPKPAVELD